MKFFVSLLLMAALSFALGLFLPWWSIAIACFLVALTIRIKPGGAFLAGFLALFLLWGWLSFYISQQNDHVLANKVSMLVLKKKDPNMLMLLTGAIGALVGGFSALSGSLLRSMFKKA